MTLIDTGKLLLLGILSFLLSSTLLRGGALDLMLVYSVMGAYLYRVKGGLTAGFLSGFLVGSVSTVPLFKMIFFYSLVGYLAALVLDLTLQNTFTQKLGTSLLLSALVTLISNSLLTGGGLTRLDQWDLQALLPHTVLFFVLFAVIANFSRDEHGLARRIVA